MTKHILASFSALAATSLLGVSAFAGTVVQEGKAAKEVIKESCISGDIGVDFTSQYITRGIPLENQGVIAQPYADLYFKLYEGSGALTKLSLNLGAWSSVHSHKYPTATGSTSSWFEFDYTIGATMEFGKLSVTPSFFCFLSPNDSFADNYNFNVNVAYDDSDLLGAFALHPHVAVMVELDGKVGSGPDEGIYYEIGIAPSFKAGAATITLPINLGLGSSGFYGDATGGGSGDDTFGYVSAGVAAEYPLAFMPECLGTWAAKANVTFYHLGDNASASANPLVNDGDENQWSFGGGLVCRF